MSKSRVTYLQYTLKFVHGMELEVDGVFGPTSKESLRIALKDAGLAPINTSANWLKYLDHAAVHLFAAA